VAALTFSGSKPEVLKIRKRAAAAGAPLGPMRDFDEPGGGTGFLVEGPVGRSCFALFLGENRTRSASASDFDEKSVPRRLVEIAHGPERRPGGRGRLRIFSTSAWSPRSERRTAGALAG